MPDTAAEQCARPHRQRPEPLGLALPQQRSSSYLRTMTKIPAKTTGVACAALALAAWLVYVGSSREEALVFALVWTAMAAAYSSRVFRSTPSA